MKKNYQNILIDLDKRQVMALIDPNACLHSRGFSVRIWWTCRDLNSGPLPCQGSALPSCATRPVRLRLATAI